MTPSQGQGQAQGSAPVQGQAGAMNTGGGQQQAGGQVAGERFSLLNSMLSLHYKLETKKKCYCYPL